jgi:hypothetical protein
MGHKDFVKSFVYYRDIPLRPQSQRSMISQRKEAKKNDVTKHEENKDTISLSDNLDPHEESRCFLEEDNEISSPRKAEDSARTDNGNMAIIRRIKHSMDSGIGLIDILRDPRNQIEKIKN